MGTCLPKQKVRDLFVKPTRAIALWQLVDFLTIGTYFIRS